MFSINHNHTSSEICIINVLLSATYIVTEGLPLMWDFVRWWRVRGTSMVNRLLPIEGNIHLFQTTVTTHIVVCVRIHLLVEY